MTLLAPPLGLLHSPVTEYAMDVEPAALLILTSVSDSLTLMADALGFEQDYIERHQNRIVQMLLAGLKVDV